MADRWPTRQDLVDDLEGLESTIHAGSPRSPSNFYCFAKIDEVLDLIWPEIERLRELAYYHCGQGNQCTWRDRWETTCIALDKAERERDSLQSILDDQVVLANALGALLDHPHLSDEAIGRTLRARRQRHRDRLEGR